MPSWRLVDAAQLAAQHKYTVYRAKHDTIARVAAGDTVKLIFEFDSDNPSDPAAERLWVLVDRVDGQGGFEGRLNNSPVYIGDLKLDDPVRFRDIHIIATESDDSESGAVEKYLPLCIVSNRVLADGKKVGYLWREEPRDDTDSGWMILAGDESDAYLDDSNNFSCVSLGAVLDLDDSFLALLKAPVGKAYERHPKSGKFIEDAGEE